MEKFSANLEEHSEVIINCEKNGTAADKEK